MVALGNRGCIASRSICSVVKHRVDGTVSIELSQAAAYLPAPRVPGESPDALSDADRGSLVLHLCGGGAGALDFPRSRAFSGGPFRDGAGVVLEPKAPGGISRGWGDRRGPGV